MAEDEIGGEIGVEESVATPVFDGEVGLRTDHDGGVVVELWLELEGDRGVVERRGIEVLKLEVDGKVAIWGEGDEKEGGEDRLREGLRGGLIRRDEGEGKVEVLGLVSGGSGEAEDELLVLVGRKSEGLIEVEVRVFEGEVEGEISS